MGLKFFSNSFPVKVGLVTQARMTSTRLPGKVLMKAGGKSLLDHHFDRLGWSGFPVYMATTVNQSDDVLEAEAKRRHIGFFRGDEQNVLSRFYYLAEKNQLEVIVRVTSDCPLIDGSLIAAALEDYLKWNNHNIYYSNCLERTFPRGFDFEIFSFAALKQAFENANEASQKEHVTPYINQNKSGLIEIRHFKDSDNLSRFRFTVDEPDDFKLIAMMMNEDKMYDLRYPAIKDLVLKNPERFLLNAHVEQKKA